MVYSARPAWRYQWPAIVGVLVLGALFLYALLGGITVTAVNKKYLLIILGALSIYFCLLIVYRKYSWRFMVDDENIESHRGIIARNVKSIRIRDLRNINVNQTIMQRILGVGDVEFSSAAGGGVEVIFFGVDHPLQVKDLAHDQQEAIRQIDSQGD